MPQSPRPASPAQHHTATRQADHPHETRRHADPQREAQNRRFAIDAARLASDLHCEDAILFDVRGLSDLTDYILIASGTSDRQIKSVADDIEELARETGLTRLGRELDGSAKWVVVDFVDVVVHLFDPETRAHYDLEMLWGDAGRVPWRREG